MSSPALSDGRASLRPERASRRTLIFDFDGTLADTLSAIVRMVNDHAAEFHIRPLNDQDVENLRGLSNLEIIRKYRIPLVKIPALIIRSQQELHHRMDEVELFPGIRELVLALRARGFRLGILTSNSRANVQKLLRAKNLDVFDFIHAEPHLLGKTRALLHLIRQHDLILDEILYIGDEVRDIEACRKISVAVAAVSWGFHRRDTLSRAQPTFLVDTPQEILSILEA